MNNSAYVVYPYDKKAYHFWPEVNTQYGDNVRESCKDYAFFETKEQAQDHIDEFIAKEIVADYSRRKKAKQDAEEKAIKNAEKYGKK